MITFDVSKEKVGRGIAISLTPYPHVVLGFGGNKPATWIPLGKQDSARIVKTPVLPCPRRGSNEHSYDKSAPEVRTVCRECGVAYDPWVKDDVITYRSVHPQSGEVHGSPMIEDVELIALKDEKGDLNGKFLIVAPRGDDNRVLVLWRVPSGYRGDAKITPGEGVTVIATDSSWHSGQGNLGETAEMLAVLQPGQELYATRSGRRLQDTKAVLAYDGEKLSVVFGGDELDAAITDNANGEYL